MTSSMQAEWLPKSVKICGTEYAIRSDFRVIIDICKAIENPEWNKYEKTIAALVAFYPEIENMPTESYREALEKCMWFIRCGDEDAKKKPVKLLDWGQDIKYIVAPINRIVGKDIREMEYMHWWTFMGYFLEIGDCFFAQIVNIRQKVSSGKKLTAEERKFYANNRSMVDIKQRYTEAEMDFIQQWT